MKKITHQLLAGQNAPQTFVPNRKATSNIDRVGRLKQQSITMRNHSDGGVDLISKSEKLKPLGVAAKESGHTSRPSANDISIIADASPDSAEFKLYNILINLKNSAIEQPLALNIISYMLECSTRRSGFGLYQQAMSILKKQFTDLEIGNLIRQQRQEYPLLKAVDKLSINFKDLLEPRVEDSLKIKLLKSYRSLCVSLSQEPERWIRCYALSGLEQAAQFIAPPANKADVNKWRRQYDKLLPLMINANLSPVDLTASDIRRNKGVNMEYLYTDEDIESLLNIKLNLNNSLGNTTKDEFNPVNVGLSVKSSKEMKSRIVDWLTQSASEANKSKDSILVVPYCPELQNHESSHHWVGLVISKNTQGVLKAAYIDTLESRSKVPSFLYNVIKEAVAYLPKSKSSQMVSIKKKDLMQIQHTQQADGTSCGAILAYDLSRIIEGWQKTKNIPDNVQSSKTAVDIRYQQIEDFGGMTSDFATRQMWNLHFDSTLDINILQQQEWHISNLVIAMGKMPHQKLNTFLQKPQISLIRPYVPYSTADALGKSRMILSPTEMINQAHDIFVPIRKIDIALASLDKRSPSTANSLKKLLQSVDQGDDFDPAEAIASIRGFITANDGKLGDTSEKTTFIQAFFPEYDPESRRDINDLSICKIEAIQMLNRFYQTEG